VAAVVIRQSSGIMEAWPLSSTPKLDGVSERNDVVVEKKSVKAPAKAPAKAAVKAPAKAPPKAPATTTTKAPAKAAIKEPAKAAAKAPAQAAAKEPVKAVAQETGPPGDGGVPTLLAFIETQNLHLKTTDADEISPMKLARAVAAMADLTGEPAPDEDSAVFLGAWKRSDQCHHFWGPTVGADRFCTKCQTPRRAATEEKDSSVPRRRS
jgi:hypothetical protein